MTSSQSIFVLGPNEHRVTVYSQQCRAINLAWALEASGRAGAGASAAVVGGGIGGVTAAIALAHVGVTVTLFERSPRVMAVQQGSHTRFLHPHLYDWPSDGWDTPHAGLPVMDWKAGSAGEVVESLRVRFDAERSNGALSVVEGEVTAIEETAQQQARVTFNAPGGAAATFDLAVAAVGYGRELASPLSRSYWSDDDLHQLDEGRVLVSGCGDGGITDVLRACIDGFEHSELPDLLAGPWLPGLKDRILALELDLSKDDHALQDAYRQDFVVDELLANLRARAQDRIGAVTLNGRTTRSPFERRAAPLNRFLLAHLMELGLSYQHGDIAVTSDTLEDGFAVTFGARPGASTFNHVILRHGPVGSPLAALALRPRLDVAAASGLPLITDVSRRPAWPDEFLALPEPEPPVGEAATAPADMAIAPAAPPAPLAIGAPDPASGWRVVTRDDVTRWEQADWRGPVLEFLDGTDPEWEVVVQRRVPEREAVKSILEQLQKRIRPRSGPGISRIVGPSGEGKSTILRQVVVNMLGHGSSPVIIFRAEPTRTLPWDLIEAAAPNRPLILVADDAHDLRRALAQLNARRMQNILATRSVPIHVLLSATQVLWDASFGDDPSPSAFTVYDPWHVAGLTAIDADRIITCLEGQEDPGQALGRLAQVPPTQRREALLRSAAENGASPEDGALLGALLEQRTGKKLDEHVAELLEHLAHTSLSTGHELLPLYLQIGSLQFHGLGAIDQETLATALDFPYEGLAQNVADALPTEVQVVNHGSRASFRLRHDAIAHAAFARALAAPHLRGEVASVHYELVNAVVRLNPEGWRDPNLAEVFYLSTKLMRDRETDIALAAAEGAVAGAPFNLHLLSKLAWTLREGGLPDGAERAAERISRFLEKRYSRVYGLVAMRALMNEWAVCCGNASTDPVRAARENLCLAIMGLSDQIAFDAPTPVDEFGRCLVVAGYAVLQLDDLETGDVDESDFANLVAVADAAAITNQHVRRLRERRGDVTADPGSAVEELLAIYHRMRREIDLWIVQDGAVGADLSLDTLRTAMGLQASA